MFKECNSNSEEPLKLIVIKTGDKVYISDNITGDRYYRGNFGTYLCDGVTPKKSYVDSWYIVLKIPKEITKIIPGHRINRRYELKEGYPVTEETPAVIPYEDTCEDSEFEGVLGLYEYKDEITEESIETVEFEVVVLDEINGFVPVEPKFELKYNLVDRLKFHPVLLTTRPCRLSSKESYKIIRNYVKTHIDLRVAEITSDHDFCFTVQKRIRLAKIEPYQVDVNVWNGRKRKPKYETRYRKERFVEIYAVAPKPYQKYTVVTPFCGEDYEELQKNIKEFLDNLMAIINEPLVDCPHCNGMGVIVDVL